MTERPRNNIRHIQYICLLSHTLSLGEEPTSQPQSETSSRVKPRAASFEPVQKNFVSIYTSTLNEPHLTEQSRVTQSSPLCRICFNQYLAMHVYDSVSAMYMYIHVGTIQYYSM